MKKETKVILSIMYIAFVVALTLLDVYHVMNVQMIIGVALAVLTLVAGAFSFSNTSGTMPWYDQKQFKDNAAHSLMNYKTFLVLSLPLIISFVLLIYM